MPKRICQIIKVRRYHTIMACHILTVFQQLKPSAEEEYKAIHAAVWPGVLAALERAHITDYSIHHCPPLQLLIATFKYTGSDYEGDMKKVSEDSETQRWWTVTDGMQESFVDGAEGSGKDIPWWTVSNLLMIEETILLTGTRSWKKYLDSKGKRDVNTPYEYPVQGRRTWNTVMIGCVSLTSKGLHRIISSL